MYNLKKIFECLAILLCLVCFTGCTQKIERGGVVDYEVFSKKIFENIPFEYKNLMNKEQTIISNVYVGKKDMPIQLFNSLIVEKIKKDGWVGKKAEFEDQQIYCHGANNSMSIIYPRKVIYTNDSGGVINIKNEDLDKWVISFMYNSKGLKECN